ncbi:MAG: alpha/beta fold hydrolase [Acidimicrobiia bacterium]
MLNVRTFGEGPLIVALHGWTLTGQQFARTGDSLGRSIVAPDLPGHGESATERTSVHAVVTSIANVLSTFGHPVPLLGYSQGGRMALITAVIHPSFVSSLILISANAGIRDPGDRTERERRDQEFAASIQQMQIDEFVDDWTERPLTSTKRLPEDRRKTDRAVRLSNTVEGLGAALAGYGQGAQPNVWDRLGELRVPTLLIAGERDENYASIAKEMGSAIEDASVVIIPDAGHDPMADKPDQTWQAVSSFLDRNG